MAPPGLSLTDAREAIAAVEQALRAGWRPAGRAGPGPAAIAVAAEALGVPRATMQKRLATARLKHGIEPDWSLWKPATAPRIAAAPPRPAPAPVPEAPPRVAAEPVPPRGVPADLAERILSAIRKEPLSLAELAARFQVSAGTVLDEIEAAHARGANLHQLGDRWSLERAQAPSYSTGRRFEYLSRPDNSFVFGVTADNHLCSKYERLDALETNYDRFAERGVDRVFNCGNWIDGEARFNRTEIHTHGMDGQLRYLVEKYPRRPGLVTYAVSGDDHEGWYDQREGVSIGRRAELEMRAAGREDWVDLGFMEAHVALKNANSGKEATLSVVHPGGGSAYADSYVVQKIIESLDGGEKPACALYGHYHKCLAGQYRNVWWILVPSTKDQDTFMRKKRLRSVVGGGIVTLRQDPASGAIYAMAPELWQFFNRGFYNDRWSHAGEGRAARAVDRLSPEDLAMATGEEGIDTAPVEPGWSEFPRDATLDQRRRAWCLQLAAYLVPAAKAVERATAFDRFVTGEAPRLRVVGAETPGKDP